MSAKEPAMKVRRGEKEQTRFRASRFFNVGDDVYFNTREGKVVGPFINMKEAEKSEALYKEFMQKSGHSDSVARRIATQGVWASTNFS